MPFSDLGREAIKKKKQNFTSKIVLEILILLVRVSIDIKNIITKAAWERKSLFLVIVHSSSSQEVKAGSQGRISDAEAEAEATEDHCFLA